MPASYTITFACYNQLAYTRKFIDSLDRAEVDFSRIVAVDNGSTDGTRQWLQGQGFGAVILNQSGAHVRIRARGQAAPGSWSR